jgi:hypothetical protein
VSPRVLLCGCSFIRVPGQYVGVAHPTVDVLSVCHDHARPIPARAAEPAKPTTTILPAETGDYGRPSREVVGPFPEDMR